MALRKSRKRRVAGAKSSTKPSPQRMSAVQRRDLRTLIEALFKPTPQAHELARETISRIVKAKGNEPVDTFDQVLFLASASLSVRTLPGYATLDSNHIANIEGLISKINKYTEDLSQKRPLNFLMLASAGAGKSHFIKCIAQALRHHKITAITFNMTALQTNEDLMPALDAARNMKVEDSVPLLFLDEFDSKPSNISMLLPLLWDGELNLGQRDLKLGRVIVVLAGSDPSLPGMMDSARSMRSDVAISDGSNPKIVDLLSRINGGVIQIPIFYDPAHGIDRRTDKACVAMQLLRLRFGEELKTAPRALLRFIVETEFRYGVRSIAHLIELIPHRKNVRRLHMKDLKLPIQNVRTLKDSSLAYHLLHEERVHGVVDRWKSIPPSDVTLPVFTDISDYVPSWIREFKDIGLLESIADRLAYAIDADSDRSRIHWVSRFRFR